MWALKDYWEHEFFEVSSPLVELIYWNDSEINRDYILINCGINKALEPYT